MFTVVVCTADTISKMVFVFNTVLWK